MESTTKKWPHIIDCVEDFIIQTPLTRLGKHQDNAATSRLCPLEALKELKPIHRKAIEGEKTWHLAQVNILQDALRKMCKKAAQSGHKERTNAEGFHDLRTDLLSVNWHIWDYVMIRSNKVSEAQI